jgi:hypothetical protein
MLFVAVCCGMKVGRSFRSNTGRAPSIGKPYWQPPRQRLMNHIDAPITRGVDTAIAGARVPRLNP